MCFSLLVCGTLGHHRRQMLLLCLRVRLRVGQSGDVCFFHLPVLQDHSKLSHPAKLRLGQLDMLAVPLALGLLSRNSVALACESYVRVER